MSTGLSDESGGDYQAMRQRLQRVWSAGDTARFWSTVSEELLPRLIRSLEAKFEHSTLTKEDIEDCCQSAIEPFIDGRAAHVADPMPYIWQSARNACVDEIRSRKRRKNMQVVFEVQFTRETGLRPCGAEIVISRAVAVAVVEEVVEGAEAEESWAVGVVEEAIVRLPPSLRRVANYVMTHDIDKPADEAAAALGIGAKTYRANKSRAFAKLREVIPEVIRDMGVTPPQAAQESIFGETWHMEPDDNTDEP